MSDVRTIFWRRLDSIGLERFSMGPEAEGLVAFGVLVTDLDGGVAIEHEWLLDADWSPRRVTVRHAGRKLKHLVRIERAGSSWSVNGEIRPELEGVVDVDLSHTPFCNSIPVRRLGSEPGATLDLDAAYIDGSTLEVVRSKQRYERIDASRARYIDLGVAKDFEAVIEFADDGLVRHYEHLFERVAEG